MIDVVLPVLDEAEALPHVLRAMPDGFRPVVADNGSTDGSAEVARAHGAVVVTEPQRGFGAACWAGLQAAEAEIVCFMDCDGSLDPGDLPRVAGPVVSGRADLVLAARDAERGAWPWPARLANRALALELRRRTGLRLHDIGPMRAAWRQELLDLGLQDRRFGWPLEMVLKAHAAGWRVQETRAPYRPRHAGRSKVTGTFRGFVRTVRDMTAVMD